MWSVLENVSCALEKKEYSSSFEWNVLKISRRSISSNISFKTCISFLILCFDDLSIGVSGVLKSPTITVLLLISPFVSSVQFSSVQSLGRVRLFATPWTVAYQAPLSMEFTRQEYWSGFPYVHTI